MLSKSLLSFFPGQKVILPMLSFTQLKNLHFDPPNAVIHVGGTLSVELTLENQMPVPVNVDHIAINVHYSIEKNSYRKTAEWLTKHKTSNGVISFPSEVVGLSLARSSLPMLELYEMYERSPSDNSLNTTGIICKNVHMLLRRQESSSSLEIPMGLTLEDGAHVLKCSNFMLEPGINKITFRTQVCFHRRHSVTHNCCVFNFATHLLTSSCSFRFCLLCQISGSI